MRSHASSPASFILFLTALLALSSATPSTLPPSTTSPSTTPPLPSTTAITTTPPTLPFAHPIGLSGLSSSAQSSDPSSPHLILELLRRQAANCPAGYAGCAAYGVSTACCSTNAICTVDEGNDLACCPSGAACTGTIGQAGAASGVAGVGTTGTDGGNGVTSNGVTISAGAASSSVAVVGGGGIVSVAQAGRNGVGREVVVGVVMGVGVGAWGW